jgi:membrane protease YdiL (CAAX protease family)
VVNAAFSSLVYGGAYLLFGRNLWVPILAHGSANPLALALIFFDLAPSLRQ